MTNFFENNTATITNSETQTSKTIGFHLKNLLAEPLVQFLILGAIIFAVDGYISANHRDNPYLIHIDDKKLSELITIFEEGQGRMPSTKEVENMIVQWSQNEILFREGQQLSLHKGDEMIRSRLILKMRNILLNSVVIEVPTEKQLKMWFDQFKDNYKIPASISLELTVAATSEVEAKATAAELNHADHAAAKNLYNIRRYQNRPVNSVTAFFNESGQQQIDDETDHHGRQPHERVQDDGQKRAAGKPERADRRAERKSDQTGEKDSGERDPHRQADDFHEIRIECENEGKCPAQHTPETVHACHSSRSSGKNNVKCTKIQFQSDGFDQKTAFRKQRGGIRVPEIHLNAALP